MCLKLVHKREKPTNVAEYDEIVGLSRNFGEWYDKVDDLYYVRCDSLRGMQ